MSALGREMLLGVSLLTRQRLPIVEGFGVKNDRILYSFPLERSPLPMSPTTNHAVTTAYGVNDFWSSKSCVAFLQQLALKVSYYKSGKRKLYFPDGALLVVPTAIPNNFRLIKAKN